MPRLARSLASACRWTTLPALLVLLTLLAAGCDGAGPGGPSPDSPSEEGTVYDVRYAEAAVVLEGDDAAALVAVEGTRYLFDAEALATAGVTLEAGQVVLVEERALRRVVSVSGAGDRVTAQTVAASLDELIADGTLAWEQEVDFASFERAQLVVAHDAATLRAGEGRLTTCAPTVQGTTVRFECTFEDYEMTFAVAAQQTTATVQYLVTKNGPSGATASFTGTGTVSSFNQQGRVEYRNSTLASAEYDTGSLQVDMEVELAASGAGAAELDYELPVAALKFPFSVGPIPMYVGIGVQVVASLDVPLEAQASATASAAYRYSGETGFTFEGSEMQAAATVTGHDFTDGAFDSASRFAPVDAQFGIAFPRVSLGVFASEVAWVHTGFTIGSRITFGPVCKSGYTRLLVDAGYDLTLMGVTIAEEETTLAERQRRVSQDDCAASLRPVAAF